MAPIGSIVAFAGPESEVPPEWLICDGRLLDRTRYSQLFDVIGTSWGGDATNKFALPDLRGRFLRGVDRSEAQGLGGRDPDADAREHASGYPSPGNRGNAVGSMQVDTIQEHRHSHSLSYPNLAGTNHTLDASRGGDKWNTHPPAAQINLSVDGVSGARTSGETRPKNAYVFWIIRAR